MWDALCRHEHWRNPGMAARRPMGFSGPPRDAQALEQKLGVLLNDRDMRISFGQKGRAFALENYGPKQHEDNLLRIINEYL